MFTRQAGEQVIRCCYNLGSVRRVLPSKEPSEVIWAQNAERSGSARMLEVNGALWEIRG
jgi:hypothetical protein